MNKKGVTEKKSPKTYRILRPLRVQAWILGGVLLAGSAGLVVLPLLALFLSPEFDPGMIIFPVAGLTVGFFSFMGLIYIQNRKIIFGEDAMISQKVFKKYRLPFDEIKGYRIDAQDTVTFVPQTKGEQVISFSRFMEGHDWVLKEVVKHFHYLDLEEAIVPDTESMDEPLEGKKADLPGCATGASRAGKRYVIQSSKLLVKLAWIASGTVMAGALLMGISPFIWEMDHPEIVRTNYPIAAFVFFNLAFWTLIYIYRNRVIIDGEKIVHIGMFRKKKMYLRDIKGYKIDMTDIYPTIGFTAGGAMFRSSKYFSRPVQFIHFISNNPDVDDMRVETYFGGTRALLTWTENNFPNLEQFPPDSNSDPVPDSNSVNVPGINYQYIEKSPKTQSINQTGLIQHE